MRDKELITTILNAVHEQEPVTTLIHGAATGVDTLADQWAKDLGIPVEPYPADWDDLSHPDAVIRTHRQTRKHYDKMAGVRRNQKMVDESNPDLVLAFPEQVSQGTYDLAERALSKRYLTIIIPSTIRHWGSKEATLAFIHDFIRRNVQQVE